MPEPNQTGAVDPRPIQSGLSDNAAGGIAYITFIPAIVFLVIEPFNKNSYVRFHSWQSIFMACAWAGIDIVFGLLLRAGPFLGILSWILIQMIGLSFFIAWIVVLIKAFNGSRFKLPIIGDLAEKQAGR